MKARTGRMTTNATRSLFWSAIVFGTSSATTISSAVINANVMTSAIPWALTGRQA